MKLLNRKQISMKSIDYMDEKDLVFLKMILPHNITYKNLYYKAGKKFVTVLLVYKYPVYIDDLLFASIFNSINATITFDIIKKEKEKAVKEAELSLNELIARSEINRNIAETLNDSYELDDMKDLHASLKRSNEDIVSTTLRIYIEADSLETLEEQANSISKKLKVYGIETTIPEFEMQAEFRALTSNSNSVGNAIPVVETLSRQYPFYFQSHIDNTGLLFGITPTDGLVILDTFYVDKDRKSFDLLISGQKGSGKSTLLKSMIQDMVSLDHKVLSIDVEGEQAGLAEKLGGKVVRINDIKINPLELREMFSKQFEENSNTDITKSANYTSELSRIESFFYQYIPSLTDLEADELKNMLIITYRKKAIYENTDLSSLKSLDFPTFSDLLNTIRDNLYTNFSLGNTIYLPSLTSNKIELLEKLEAYIKPLAEGMYSELFNGHSNINIDLENFVVFDISVLSEMSDRVYNAQLFNILCLIWAEIYKNRKRNQNTDNDKRHYCIAVVDEAHRLLNINNVRGLEFCEKLVRRSRKYDSTLWFASQSPRDFVPDSDSIYLDKIKNIFAMVQYKILMQQDDSNTTLLSKLFPQFTTSEIESTPYFGKGEMLLSLGSGKKIRCQRYVPEEDLIYFGGGR